MVPEHIYTAGHASRDTNDYHSGNYYLVPSLPSALFLSSFFYLFKLALLLCAYALDLPSALYLVFVKELFRVSFILRVVFRDIIILFIKAVVILNIIPDRICCRFRLSVICRRGRLRLILAGILLVNGPAKWTDLSGIIYLRAAFFTYHCIFLRSFRDISEHVFCLSAAGYTPASSGQPVMPAVLWYYSI